MTKASPMSEATPVVDVVKPAMTKREAVLKAIAYMRGHGDYADIDAVEEVLRSMMEGQ